MSERVWYFQGNLQENGNRVLTRAEGSVTEIDEGEQPKLDVSSNEGKLIIDFKIPTRKVLDAIGGVGKQYLVDGLDKNAAGQKYGEIFNDYDNNSAKGVYSHVTGYNNKGDYPYQIVFGKYNKNNKNNVLEVGYGEDEYNRKNIFAIDKEGNVKATGDVGNGKGISLDSLQEHKLDKVQFDYLVGESQPRIHKSTNKQPLSISSDEVAISSIQFITTEATTPMFWATIPFTLSETAVVTFKYYLDNVLQADDTLKQSFNAGTHFASLFNIFEIGENYGGVLKVTMSVSVGSASIEDYSIKSALYVQGVGITAAWNGKINITQNFTSFNLSGKFKNGILPIKDKVVVTTQQPKSNNIQERFNRFAFGKKISVLGFTDNVETSKIITRYVFDVLKKSLYNYNEDYVLAEENFRLRTEYQYNSVTKEIDTGNMCSVVIRTDDKKIIESVVIE